jgi:hypothetical protein
VCLVHSEWNAQSPRFWSILMAAGLTSLASHDRDRCLPGQGRYRLGSFGDGDGEAEGLDLPDVVAQLALGVEAAW